MLVWPILSIFTSSSVSVWQPVPLSWPWGWCLSVCSFTPQSGLPAAPSRSHMTVLVSTQLMVDYQKKTPTKTNIYCICKNCRLTFWGIWMVYFKGFHVCCFTVSLCSFVPKAQYRFTIIPLHSSWYEICVYSGITLVALLIPIALGIYVKRRWPRIAKKILKVGRLQFLLIFVSVKFDNGICYGICMALPNENSWAVFVSAVHR